MAAALQVMGCDAAQGWYFSRPLSPASATAWLAEHGAPRGRRPEPVAAGGPISIPRPAGAQGAPVPLIMPSAQGRPGP